jgi:molybdopterin converting factor small subunit
MTQVVISTSFCDAFTKGAHSFEIDAPNVLQLVQELDRRFPGFGAFIEERVSIVVDSTAIRVWTEPLKPDSEIFLVPRIAGG